MMRVRVNGDRGRLRSRSVSSSSSSSGRSGSSRRGGALGVMRSRSRRSNAVDCDGRRCHRSRFVLRGCCGTLGFGMRGRFHTLGLGSRLAVRGGDSSGGLRQRQEARRVVRHIPRRLLVLHLCLQHQRLHDQQIHLLEHHRHGNHNLLRLKLQRIDRKDLSRRGLHLVMEGSQFSCHILERGEKRDGERETRKSDQQQQGQTKKGDECAEGLTRNLRTFVPSE